MARATAVGRPGGSPPGWADRMRTSIMLVLALAGAACGDARPRPDTPPPSATAATGLAASAGAADSTAWTLSPSALGPIRVGMPRGSVTALLPSAPPDRAPGESGACQYLHVRSGPLANRVAFMVVNDTIVRIDVDSLPIATTAGDRVGDAEADVVARHPGRVRVEPHKYTGPEGHYLIVTGVQDTAHRLVFETDGRRVTSIRAGRRPQVDWVEGCS